MTACQLSLDGAGGISDAVRAVDCATTQATALAFDRLFGSHGTFAVALTMILTLYVAFIAINLLLGRTSLGGAMFTQRGMMFGLALTFATSWAAYQSVVWNLATGAPDEIAGALLGTNGPATTAFTDRLDAMFGAIVEATQDAQLAGAGEPLAANGGVPGADEAPAPESAAASIPFASPPNILLLAAMLLLLGTAGVLIVSRVALAALLALGPIFIVLGLFKGARGLFEGWLKAAVLFAVVPLLTVLIGSAALAMLSPLVEALMSPAHGPTMRLSVTLLVGAVIYVALMGIALKAATMLTAGWRLPGRGDPERGESAIAARAAAVLPGAASIPAAEIDRVRDVVSWAKGGAHAPDPARGTGMAVSVAQTPASMGTGARTRSITARFAQPRALPSYTGRS